MCERSDGGVPLLSILTSGQAGFCGAPAALRLRLVNAGSGGWQAVLPPLAENGRDRLSGEKRRREGEEVMRGDFAASAAALVLTRFKQLH